MSSRSFVDTNILVYRFDLDAPDKRDKAQQLLREEGSAGRVVLSTQVLQEFYVTVTRKLARPMPSQDALAAVQRLAMFTVVQIDPDLIVDAITLSQRHQISFWDSLILRAAQRGGCDRVLTEDLQDGWKIGGLEVVNPFA